MNKKFHPKKTLVVSELKDLLSQSKSVAVLDYRGLKVSQITELRKTIKKSGGRMLVAKNTLFKLASGLSDLNLEGTSAFVFSLADEVSAVKAVSDFAKKNQLPTFKLGLLQEQVLSKEQITALSALPDKPAMISSLLGSLNAPVYRLVYNLNWNIGQVVRVLDAVAKSKGVN